MATSPKRLVLLTQISARSLQRTLGATFGVFTNLPWGSGIVADVRNLRVLVISLGDRRLASHSTTSAQRRLG